MIRFKMKTVDKRDTESIIVQSLIEQKSTDVEIIFATR